MGAKTLEGASHTSQENITTQISILGLLKYSLNVSQRAHVRLLSSSRGVATFTGAADTNVRQQLPHSTSARLWSSSCAAAGVSVAHRRYSTQQAESAEEDTLHTIISDTENVQGSYSKHEFQAETKKLLDIVARSLYSEKEVFIRELISNSSDALEKLRHKMITAGGETAPMEIHLQTDAATGTFTIQVPSLNNTHFQWLKTKCCSGVFEIAEASGVRQGTKIVLHFKDDCKEFSSEDRVKEVVTKYSNFVSFPIFLNGRRLNTLQALWMMEPKDISERQHEEFYRYVAQAHDKPRYTLHYRADAPLNIRSIFYVPEMKPSMFDASREMGSSVALYSRKVLIQTKATDILPKWLRFLRGVVDSEDIPLNLSRELLQESALIRKLRDVLQQRVIRFLLDQSKKDPEKYARFFDDYGLFMREGIVTTAEQSVKEDIAKLLRFESSALPAGQQTSLMEYASRMKAGTRNIYYLCAPNRHLAEHSPYFEAMKQKDMEVLFCFEQFDELTLLHLREFDRKKLISAETDIVVDHYKEEKFQDSKPASERLTDQQAEDLMAWMRNALVQRVTNIKVTPRLDTHPAMITVLEMGAARHFLRTQQLARSSEERAQILQPTLEINTGHDLIKKLHALKDSNPELAQLLLEQIYDNAMITAGLNEDPRPMISRLNQLLTQALENRYGSHINLKSCRSLQGNGLGPDCVHLRAYSVSWREP
uniref:TNF receptor-associated protein 1 n=1 Tax=Sinocyclocheilus grahami TaxID=75366 RepID=A0A672NG08_SINGR